MIVYSLLFTPKNAHPMGGGQVANDRTKYYDTRKSDVEKVYQSGKDMWQN